MNHPVNELNKNTPFAARLFLATLLITATSVSMADDTNVAYVDSVLKWGAWELDIEPAAGGISVPTTKALNARGSKVALRTNSIAALAPPLAPGGGTLVNTGVPGTPAPQRPAIPINTPISTVPTAPTTYAPPAATPPTVVTLAPPVPTSPAPSGAVTATVVTLP